MEHYAGIDVSLESASLYVVDATGRIVREAKVASEPEVLIGWFRALGLAVTRIGRAWRRRPGGAGRSIASKASRNRAIRDCERR
jgi:hypothetical protein